MNHDAGHQIWSSSTPSFPIDACPKTLLICSSVRPRNITTTRKAKDGPMRLMPTKWNAILLHLPILLLLGVTSVTASDNNNNRWGIGCPFDGLAWVHPTTGDTLQVERHCLASGRCYNLFVPNCATVDSPMVMVLHGRSGCPFEVEETTRWGQLATTECFVTVYPEVREREHERSAKAPPSLTPPHGRVTATLTLW